MRGSLFVSGVAALATIVFMIALITQGSGTRRTELTFADGTVQPLAGSTFSWVRRLLDSSPFEKCRALTDNPPSPLVQVSDVPSLVDEADANVDDGVAPLDGDHVGYWERPGNDNNLAYADLAEAKMDRRMRSEDPGAQFWQTKGTDFFDTEAQYKPFTDGDDVHSSGWLGQFDNSWAGTGQGLYDYDDLEKGNDMYDGGFPIRQVEGEAADDAYVSGTDFIGYKAHPAQLRARAQASRRGARLVQLWNAAANDEVSALTLGKQHRWDMNDRERAFYAPVQPKGHNRKFHPEVPRRAQVTDATDMDFHPQQWLREQSGL